MPSNEYWKAYFEGLSPEQRADLLYEAILAGIACYLEGAQLLADYGEETFERELNEEWQLVLDALFRNKATLRVLEEVC